MVSSMSGEALKQEIRKSAEEKAKTVATEAKNKADAILAEAETEAKGVLDGRVRDAERRLEQIERSEGAKARMECTKNILGLESKYIEQAFSEAEARLEQLPTGDPKLYRKILTDFIAEAAGQLGGARFVAIANSSDRKLVEEIVRGSGDGIAVGGRTINCTVSNESLDSKGGIVLRTEDMRSYFINTFESRLLRAREELRARVADVLLGRQSN